MRPAFQWPVRFAKRPLKARLVTYRAGDLFHLQDIPYIRSLGPAYGVPDSRTRDFATLDYVQTLDVHTQPMAQAIIAERMNFKRAQHFLEGRDG